MQKRKTLRSQLLVSSRLPIDMLAPEGILLPCGAIRVHLRSLEAVERFWHAHRDAMPYSAEGHRNYSGEQEYLPVGNWIFGPTKISVVKTLVRWDELEADCEWYDWARAEPKEHARFFVDQEDLRAFYRSVGTWTDQNEQNFLAKTPETYRGWWEFKNVPLQMADIRSSLLPAEIYERSATKQVILDGMQEAVFNHGLEGRVSPMGHQITFRDAFDLDRFVEDLREDDSFREAYDQRESVQDRAPFVERSVAPLK